MTANDFVTSAAALLSLVLAPAAIAARLDDGARSPALAPDVMLERIALGSCLHQHRDQSILNRITADRPDLMLYLGDNVYGDIRDDDVEALENAYIKQAGSTPLNRLRSTTPRLAVWDDHDYGLNDAGAEFPFRAEAKAFFTKFWHIDPARFSERDGIEDAWIVGPPGRRIQFILLDTRSYRSRLKPTDARGAVGKERYLPDPAPDKTMLGDDQWAWLAGQLQQPADLRVIVSSIQVIADGHGWEAWRALPAERERFYDTLRETGAEGVILVSGDRHRAGIYTRTDVLDYPLWEFTTSSLNLPIESGTEEPGPYRVGPSYRGANYGLIDIDWREGRLLFEVVDEAGGSALMQSIALADLRR